MGGSIGVHSQVDEGSVFWIELPLPYIGEKASIIEPIDVEYPTVDTQPIKTENLKVLVVDDILPNQLVARKLIEKHGHKVDVAGDGLQAVQAVQNKQYDLVFMDIRMPELDGLEATRRIRALPDPVSEVMIIAMTANALKEDVEECLQAGMDDFVAKPIDRDKLRMALEKASGFTRG